MQKFDIINEIERPTNEQLTDERIFNQFVRLFHTAESFRMELLRILNEHFLFYLLEEKENLIIRYKSDGKHIFDYSTIKDKKLRNEIKMVIENTLPIKF